MITKGHVKGKMMEMSLEMVHNGVTVDVKLAPSSRREGSNEMRW